MANNIFIGPDAAKDYLDMSQHEPTSCVELPFALGGNPQRKVREVLKMMGPESPLHTFKIVPTYRWFREQEKAGRLVRGVTTVVISSSGGAGLASAVCANSFEVGIIVIMPEDTPVEKQTLIRRAIGKDAEGKDNGELVLFKGGPGKPTGIDVAREMGKKENHLVFDQYGDDINWQAHEDVTIRQTFEQMDEAKLKVAFVIVAIGSSGTLIAAREYCKKHSPGTIVVAVMTQDDEPIPAVRSEKRLGPTQILFNWREGTERVKVSRYEPYRKTVQLLQYGMKVGLSTGAAIVGANKFIDELPPAVLESTPANEDGSRIAVIVSGDILDPYLGQLRVILDPEDL